MPLACAHHIRYAMYAMQYVNSTNWNRNVDRGMTLFILWNMVTGNTTEVRQEEWIMEYSLCGASTATAIPQTSKGYSPNRANASFLKGGQERKERV